MIRGTRKYLAAKAAFLCQRVEDNAFHLQQHACALRIRVIRGIHRFLNVNVFVFIRVYSWLTFADGCG